MPFGAAGLTSGARRRQEIPISPHIRAVALLDLPAIALEAGIDPYAALREAGIDAGTLHLPDVTIPADRVAWLLDGLAERSGISDLGIRIAMRRRLANLGVIGLVLGQQPTVRDALAMTQRYRHLMTDAMSIHIETEAEVSMLVVGIAIGSSAPARQMRELALSTYIHLFRLLLGEQWAPLAVHFSHSAPKGVTFHRRFFGCPVNFGSSFDGLECRSSHLDQLNVRADAAVARYTEGLLDSLPAPEGGLITSMVGRLIGALLPMGRASIDHVAKALARSVRTLQRELDREGVTFTAILVETRAKLSLEMLRDKSQSVEEIAMRLGYSHPAAFIRFFRCQYGMTPGEWRSKPLGRC